MRSLFERLGKKFKKHRPVSSPIDTPLEERFFLGKKIGQGSFATVRLATEKATGSKFAVKIIPKDKIKGKERMLKSEVQILRKMDHPNVVSLYDSYETETHVYLITDLAEGGELFDRILAKGSYVEKDAAVIVNEILDALHYLHQQDIVHRDLKPENILFKTPDPSSELQITDFGLAKIMHDDDYLKTSCGTPGYIAPEVVQRIGHGKPVDMWALGVITYILLSGYTPFYGETQEDLFTAILDGDYSFDDESWSHISSEAKDFISKLLVLDPEKRMRVEEALLHPWLTTSSTSNLQLAKEKLFDARKSFKKAVNAVTSIRRMASKSSNPDEDSAL